MLLSIKNAIKDTLFKINRLQPGKVFFVQYEGQCNCCDQKTTFVSKSHWLRDHFICTNCSSIPRERSLMYVIEKHFPNWRDLVIHETSPCMRGASLKLSQAKGYQESQYFPNVPLGSMHNNILCESLEELTLASESVDLFISQDVFEHIYHPDKAFKEIARVLKPGGVHIFTTPLVNKFNPSIQWATMNKDGSPNFLYEPEYHGNPVDDSGSPVTMHWGYDIVDYIKMNSGLETSIEYKYDIDLGIAAEYNEVLITKK